MMYLAVCNAAQAQRVVQARTHLTLLHLPACPPPACPAPVQLKRNSAALGKYRQMYVPRGVPPAQPAGTPLFLNRVYKHLQVGWGLGLMGGLERDGMQHSWGAGTAFCAAAGKRHLRCMLLRCA